MTLGERLRRLREERKLVQYDVAEAIGVRAQQISRWETNVQSPDPPQLVKLADFFAVSLDDLLRGGK